MEDEWLLKARPDRVKGLFASCQNSLFSTLRMCTKHSASHKFWSQKLTA